VLEQEQQQQTISEDKVHHREVVDMRQLTSRFLLLFLFHRHRSVFRIEVVAFLSLKKKGENKKNKMKGRMETNYAHTHAIIIPASF
jgi:hypothetical protein